MKINLWLLLILQLSLVSTSFGSQTTYSGYLSLNTDNNLSFGNFSRDIISDSSTSLSANINHSIDISSHKRVILDASASIDNYSKYDGLNNNSVNIKSTYQFQPGSSFRSPIYLLYLSLGHNDYTNNLRDNNYTQFGVSLSWQHDDRTSFIANASSLSIDADSTSDNLGNTYQTFDNTHSTLSFVINIKQTAKLSLYSSISFISGDITANWTTETLNQYEADFIDIRDAWETIPDTIFGTEWESTKYNADITKLTIGFNYSLNKDNALDVIIETLDADSGIYSYSIERFSVAYLRKF